LVSIYVLSGYLCSFRKLTSGMCWEYFAHVLKVEKNECILCYKLTYTHKYINLQSNLSEYHQMLWHGWSRGNGKLLLLLESTENEIIRFQKQIPILIRPHSIDCDLWIFFYSCYIFLQLLPAMNHCLNYSFRFEFLRQLEIHIFIMSAWSYNWCSMDTSDH